MKKLLISAMIVLTAGAAMAQDAAPATDRAARREAMKNMTPEQKAEKKKEMKAKWDAMSPEEKAAAKEKFAKNHPQAAAKMSEKAAEKKTAP